MSEFVDSPIGESWIKSNTDGGPGTYNGDDCGPFGEYRRTATPNGPKEKIIDAHFTISGEGDQGFGSNGTRYSKSNTKPDIQD